MGEDRTDERDRRRDQTGRHAAAWALIRDWFSARSKRTDEPRRPPATRDPKARDPKEGA